jgi:hypothetical protein
MREETIWDLLNRDLYFIKDAVKPTEAKFSDKLDVYDPEQRSITLEVREPSITTLTKVSRLYGGSYDIGGAFDLVANAAGSTQQALRIARATPTFVLNSGPVEISDSRENPIGNIKKIVWTIGRKFKFTDRIASESFIIELRTNVFGTEVGFMVDGKKVGGVVRKWKDSHEDYFKSGKFGYALWISPEVEKSSRLRQVLIAFGIGQHRIIP